MKTPPLISVKNRNHSDVNEPKTRSGATTYIAGGGLFSSHQTNIQSFFTTFKKPRGMKRSRTPDTPPPEKSPVEVETPPSTQSTTASLVSTPPPDERGGELTKEDDRSIDGKRQYRSKPAFQQMYLDLGQRDFARQTICQTCGMLYVHGLSEDARQHKKICQDYLQGIPFENAKNERIVDERNGDIIVEIRSSDSYALRQKIVLINGIVDNDLGFALPNDPDRVKNQKSYLFVRERRVVAMATAEPIKKGFALKSPSERSNVSRQAMVGIHKIWVHKKCREMGVASMLVDAVRSKFQYGMVVPVQMIAFSSPTEAGTRFAAHYLRAILGKDTAVLVYDCV